MESLALYLSDFRDIVWGVPMILLLLGTHIYLTYKTGFIQRKVPLGIKLSITKDSGSAGDVSQFQALTTALASTIGTGNIIGVGTAVYLGGPGAVFWCWITGVFGIATKYAESLIGVKYRVQSKDGRMLGGAMYALERGLKMKKMAIAFALFAMLASFGIGCATQINAIAEVFDSNLAFIGVPRIYIGIFFGILTALIIIGGIGFFIWSDISENGLHFRKYRLHTKITILMTLFLIFGGAVILFILEYYNTIAGRPLNEQILCSLFGSVTARTAGFNTVDTGALTDSSKLVTILLMFIGGSPGSTAGGIKTTTAVVLIAHVYAGLFDKKECSMFGRRIGEDAVRKASTVLCTNLMLCAAAVVIIVTATSIDVTDVMFEVASAMGTVGMSAGITRDLDTISKLVLIFLMFCGRVGSFTFALSMKGHKVDPPVKLPEEEVMVG